MTGGEVGLEEREKKPCFRSGGRVVVVRGGGGG